MTTIEKKASVGKFEGLIFVHEQFNATDVFVGPDGKALNGASIQTNIENVYNNETERTSGTYSAGDIGKIYLQKSDNTLWLLTNNSPQEWLLLGGSDQIFNYVYNTETDRTTKTYTQGDIGKIARQVDDNSLWALVNVDGNGTGTWVQLITNELIGQPNGVASLDSGGRVPVEQMPELDAAKVTTGEFDAARIPSLDAAKVTTGEFDTTRIPSLDAAKVTTGEFDTARIPNLDAAKVTTGTIDIARLPAAAIEKLTIVDNESAMLALTSEIQVGDTVKLTSTGIMYVVVNDTIPRTNASFVEYTAASAAAVPWSGITNKPLLATESQLTNHTDRTDNPHTVTLTQVGAEAANSNIQTHIATTTGNPHSVNATDVGAPTITELNNHTGNTNNPHAVTLAQVGAEAANNNIQAHIATTTGNPHSVNASDVGAATTQQLTSHTNRTDNPHAVTATQIGVAEGATANAGTVTSVQGSGAVSVTNGTTAPTISVATATASTDGLMLAAEKNKLSGIAAGATANTASNDIPLKDTTAGAPGTSPDYSRKDHSHPIVSKIATSQPSVLEDGHIWIV